jgi:hypothetical protein
MKRFNLRQRIMDGRIKSGHDERWLKRERL